MNILFWIILGLVVYLFASKMMPARGVTIITTDELKKLLQQKDIQLIDVRTQGEYQTNHIKQFKNIPLNSLKQSIHELDKNKTTILICQSGMRSMQAAKLLKRAGFTQIKNVSSGMNGWRA